MTEDTVTSVLLRAFVCSGSPVTDSPGSMLIRPVQCNSNGNAAALSRRQRVAAGIYFRRGSVAGNSKTVSFQSDDQSLKSLRRSTFWHT